eukprot:CAMPEP_0182926940 /NCGR_PEP_ID=MMETSP0105_2-20130417/12710_1 /TAXON_ID=81532 ORGANISM="Acanthoeca-like sp., Strain 10tr" /NCGR_SAMPLE_ID=MMETSP0105_2 /ASSEMBLY_ACC=CAM_ASM_000205 /LENGTH=297 /DNA_ID=CAMNT_0025064859 /DNA_START=457 /DNA_END=1347 /DNA_ORIENTATION=+
MAQLTGYGSQYRAVGSSKSQINACAVQLYCNATTYSLTASSSASRPLARPCAVKVSWFSNADEPKQPDKAEVNAEALYTHRTYCNLGNGTAPTGAAAEIPRHVVVGSVEAVRRCARPTEAYGAHEPANRANGDQGFGEQDESVPSGIRLKNLLIEDLPRMHAGYGSHQSASSSSRESSASGAVTQSFMAATTASRTRKCAASTVSVATVPPHNEAQRLQGPLTPVDLVCAAAAGGGPPFHEARWGGGNGPLWGLEVRGSITPRTNIHKFPSQPLPNPRQDPQTRPHLQTSLSLGATR